jgi:hypothetical protein
MEPLAEERNHLQSVDGSPAGTGHAGWVALHERLKRVVHVPERGLPGLRAVGR